MAWAREGGRAGEQRSLRPARPTYLYFNVAKSQLEPKGLHATHCHLRLIKRFFLTTVDLDQHAAATRSLPVFIATVIADSIIAVQGDVK